MKGDVKMHKDTTRVKVSASRTLSWPQVCVLCLKEATVEDSEAIEGRSVPYCDDCYPKVRRLRSWEQNVLLAALAIGTIGACLNWRRIATMAESHSYGRLKTWFGLLLVGLLILGLVLTVLAYAIVWGLMLWPFRLLFRSKLSSPGVKMLTSQEESGVKTLEFSNPDYADLFRRANQLAIREGEG